MILVHHRQLALENKELLSRLDIILINSNNRELVIAIFIQIPDSSILTVGE